MNSKERVIAAMARKKTDRAPLGYEGTPEVLESLLKHFNLKDEIELYEKLEVDIVKLACPTSDSAIGDWWGVPIIERTNEGYLKDVWGVQYVEQKYSLGVYVDIIKYPLADAKTVSEIIAHPVPSLDMWDMDGFAEKLKRPEYKDYYVMVCMIGCFDTARMLRGMEQFLLDLALDPEIAETLLDKTNDFLLSYFDKLLGKLHGLADGVYIGDDFGSQRGMTMSPEMWRKFIKPRYAKLASLIKSHGFKYIHHTCGGITTIVPDMIEIGLDVLNPIQPLAAGMDCRMLKDRFGDKLTFFGGIDEQQTLPFGTMDDVKNEVLDRLSTLGEGGGYIVAPAHGFQPDTSIDNILAMYEAILGYKIK